MKSVFGRFLFRQYVYPLLFIFLIILLVRWMSSPSVDRAPHSWSEPVNVKQRPASSVEDLPKPKDLVIDTQSGNVVNIEVYMESQCGDTSRFIKNHLVPTWNKLRATNRFHVAIIPFGKARCEHIPADDDYKCECQHGDTECVLNQLMNCAIHDLVYPEAYVPFIGCVQGSMSLEAAQKKCFTDSKLRSKAKDLNACAVGPRGRRLLALAGQKTIQLKPELTFVPWVTVEGKRDINAFYALEETVCKMLNPQPKECDSGKNKQNPTV